MFPCPWNNSFVTVTLNGRSLVLLKSLIFLIFNWGKISILPKQKQSHLQSCRLFCQNHGSEDSSISKKNLCVSPLPGCLETLLHTLCYLPHFSVSNVAKYLTSVEITTLQVLWGYSAKDYGATGTVSRCTVIPLYSPFCYCTVEKGSLY